MGTLNKLLEFQNKIQVIKTDSLNPHFKNKYATLPQILSVVKPILSELGLTLLQPIRNGEVFSVIVEEKTELIYSSIKLPDNVSPQQLGSAITYFRRYTLASLLALEIEDDDGNAASQKPALAIGTELYKKAVKYLKEEGGVLAKIEEKFTLSQTVREALLTDAA